jgi:hypothetical protein
MSKTLEEVFEQYRLLKRAFIDASSIIYMRKAGFLEALAAAVELHAPQEILAETGFDDLPVRLAVPSEKAASNDSKLISCALKTRWPVISEDRKILLHMKREGIPYFNALMMLNYLLFTARVDAEEHARRFERLMRHARYGRDVLDFGKSVYAGINSSRNNSSS